MSKRDNVLSERNLPRYAHNQFYAPLEPIVFDLIPEQKMLFALLARSYLDHFEFRERLEKILAKPKKLFGRPRGVLLQEQINDLEDWFASDEIHEWSFVWVCQHISKDWISIVFKFREALKRTEINPSDYILRFCGEKIK